MEGILVRMNEQVLRLFEHTGVVALLDMEGKGKTAIGTCVLLHSRDCHWAVTAGHVAAQVEQAGGQWGIVVGGLGKAPRSVPIHSPFTVQSANSEEDEFEVDLAVVKLHPHEVDGLYSAPRTKFYSGERAHRDYGPDANRAGTWGSHIMVGFHGDRSARAAPTRAETPLVMMTYPLARTGDRLTEKGRFIDFRVADGEASDQDVAWVDGERPDYMGPTTGSLDNLDGMSGSGVWRMQKAVNRDGECPIHLTGIAFLQRAVTGASLQRHVTVLGCESLNEMLDRLARGTDTKKAGLEERVSPSQVEAVKCAVGEKIPDYKELARKEAHRPAHLTVALVDAVFNPQLDYEKVVSPIVERYCRHFGLKRRSEPPQEWPPLRETEQTLSALIAAYEDHGKEWMRDEVFGSTHRSPGTDVYKSDNVLECARALHAIGIETIRDVGAKDPCEIEKALCDIAGVGRATMHMLLMYCGNEEYVKGDVHIRGFVAEALGVEKVRPELAEALVAGAARKLDVKPVELDVAIWTWRASGTR